jgi:hypothetical protein
MLGESGILDVFKPYFEDVRVKKAWHNYSFDRAVLGNHDVNTQGFAGDTMHMARLWSAGIIKIQNNLQQNNFCFLNVICCGCYSSNSWLFARSAIKGFTANSQGTSFIPSNT